MSEAAQSVTTLSFTHAVRDAEIDGVSIKENQYLGLSGGKIKAATDTLDEHYECSVCKLCFDLDKNEIKAEDTPAPQKTEKATEEPADEPTEKPTSAETDAPEQSGGCASSLSGAALATAYIFSAAILIKKKEGN